MCTTHLSWFLKLNELASMKISRTRRKSEADIEEEYHSKKISCWAEYALSRSCWRLLWSARGRPRGRRGCLMPCMVAMIMMVVSVIINPMKIDSFC